MDHNSIRHKLSEYIDGTVSQEEKAWIEEHLKACEKCSDALHELQKTIEHVRQIDEVEPPAWMTQKIMAKARAIEQKKSFYERLYSAFVVKLPVKAVAVVFLAAIAFYMYRDIRPQKLSEAPIPEAAVKNEAAPPASVKSEQFGTKDSALRSKRVPQSPEYKTLDMKGEYEKPAPPVPLERFAAPAPAAAKADKSSQKQAVLEKQAAAPTIEAKAASSSGMTAKSKSQQETVTKGPSPSSAPLHFRDYRVREIYRGKHAAVDFSSNPRAKTWSAMLIDAAKKGSNFAGHYTVAVWGCGTSCSSFAIIDAINGRVYFPAILSHVRWADWRGKEYGLKFRIDSNLLVVYGSPNEEDKKGTFYYKWENNDLQLIKSDLAK
jgi:hypothetical protein